MRVKSFLLLLLVILLLAGCSQPPTVIVATPGPATATPEPTPSPTPEPTPSPTPEPTPSPTPNPYFTDTEEVTADMDSGHWLYRSPELYVDVTRTIDEENKQTYFVADVRVQGTETERAGFSTPNRPGGKSTILYKIAQYYKAVIAVNGDFIDHNDNSSKGVIIRDGKVFLDNDNADTLVFMPDGAMQIFGGGETNADELLAQGVTNTFSFGPTLINNGVIQEGLDKARLRKANPRTAVGMVEPGHYLLVMVEGRSSRAKGMTLVDLADLFASYGCQVAYNLDGGQSATMAFMGEHISEYHGSLTGQRGVPDALMFGYSELVGADEG